MKELTGGPAAYTKQRNKELQMQRTNLKAFGLYTSTQTAVPEAGLITSWVHLKRTMKSVNKLNSICNPDAVEDIL